MQVGAKQPERLSDLIRRFDQIVPSKETNQEEKAISAVSASVGVPRTLVAQMYGSRENDAIIAVRIAELALAMKPTITMYQLRPGAVKLVDQTELRYTPSATPRLLKYPALVESNRPEMGERLFGDVTGVGWFEDQAWGGLRIVIFSGMHKVFTFWWRADWTGLDLDEELSFSFSPLILNAKEHSELAQDAIRFLVTFAVLLQAVNAPVRIEQETEEKRTKGAPKKEPYESSWVLRHIYLSEPGPAQRGSQGKKGALDKENLLLLQRDVKGHIRRQPYGPDRSMVKEIWIQGHPTHKWISTRPKRTIVH